MNARNTRGSKPGRWKPGQSGNPRGRPKGTSTADKLRAAIEGDLPEILEAMIQSAKSGDVGAARLLLERAVPSLKPTELPVSVDVQGESLTDQGRAILEAVASGRVVPAQGAILMGALAQLARLVELDEFEVRLKALEAGTCLGSETDQSEGQCLTRTVK